MMVSPIWGWLVLAYLVWRDVRELLERVVGVHEQRHAPVVVPRADDDDLLATASLPPDIEQLAANESEPWARDAVRERAWELFRTTKNWDEAKQILYAERHITLFGGEPNKGVS